MDPTIQRLVDETAIKELHLRYCRGIDRMDWELIRSCYHPDATDDHGEFVGGVDAFIEYARANLPGFLSTAHHVTNQLVDIRGDVAYAEHYGIAFHRLPGNGDGVEKDWIASVRYVDRLEKRQGRWAITNRISLVDSDRVEAVGASLVSREHQRGRRDSGDPSYMR